MPAYTDEPLFRLTVEDYHDLIDRGRLTADDPVELVEGVLVYRMPIKPPHAATVDAVADAVAPVLPAGWRYRSEKPVTLDDGEPQPDGAVTSLSRADLFVRHPGPADLALVIEVADTTLDRDRGMKLRSYARAGIPAYWIVNLVGRQVEVYADPTDDPEPDYRRRDVYAVGEAVPWSVGGVAMAAVPVEAMLPPA